MASLVLTGDTSGQVTIAAPAVAGTNTLTLLAATATNSVNTLATAVASTSGTSIDFTSIPSWVKKITVMLTGVSTNGTSNPLIQIGTSGTPTTSGYLGSANNASGASYVNYTTGFGIASGNAANLLHGAMVLYSVTGNTWIASHSVGVSGATAASCGGGSVTLGGTLNMVRITTVNGTDTFDAGSINILYE